MNILYTGHGRLAAGTNAMAIFHSGSNLPTPRDEVGYVVACKERATLCRRQKVYVAHGQNGTGGARREGLCHRFVARLPAGQILLGGVAHIVGVLQICERATKKDG